jgi:hypothetical protein
VWDVEGIGLRSAYEEFSIDNISAAVIHFPIRFQTPPEDNLEGVAAEN